MYNEITIFCIGFFVGYLFKKNEKSYLLTGLNIATVMNQWYKDVKNYLTPDYLIKGVVYFENGYIPLNEDDFDINETGIKSYKELLPKPIGISFYYKKVNYMLKLKDARQVNEIQFKSNGKSIKKFLSVMIDGKEILQELKVYAGPFENFYCLSEVLFDDLYPGCQKIEIINEFGDLETFKGNVNIISLI
jgi:hypothetical protein